MSAIQQRSDSSHSAYNQMNEIFCLAVFMEKKKTLYEIVVRGLLAKRMSGFMELQFEFLRETKRSVSLEGWIDLWHCLSSCNLWVLSEMSLQKELVL